MDPYAVDYDWAWGAPQFGDAVTLRAHLEFRDAQTARAAVTSFFDALMEENGFHGSGGWAATDVSPAKDSTERVIDFTAGGQDVADAISYAAEDAFEHFSAYEGTTVRWEQLPYDNS